MRRDYKRDIANFPLEKSKSGEEENLQEGKCNNFNYRFILDSFGERVYDHPGPKYIMQHYTSADYERTISIFTTKAVSAHYVIPKNGVVQEFVDPSYRAYHAGVGKLNYESKMNNGVSQDKNYMNSFSIGIENVNSGNEPYTKEQKEANILLCEKLSKEISSIDPKLMLGHSDWDPSRKIDPGPYFPWEDLANAVDKFEDLGITRNFGIFPKKEDLDIRSAPAALEEGSEDYISFLKELAIYGYDILNDGINIHDLEGRDPSEIFDFTKVINAKIAYKTHFCGEEIISKEYLLDSWNILHGSKTFSAAPNEAKSILGQVNENDLEFIIDINSQL
jgi:N-acetyl-anhydromuramyl-L-alanine amidase AmpD